MISRRDLILSGGLAARLVPADAQAAQGSSPSNNRDAEVRALNEIRDAVRQVRQITLSPELADIRDKQRSHFKLNQKFPDFIDVGIVIWERLYLWHLANPEELKVSRTAEGRMEMEFMFTRLLLRADLPDTLIGNPYDG